MPSIKNHPRTIDSTAKAIDGERTKWSIDGIQGLVVDCTANGKRSWYVNYYVGVGAQRTKRQQRLGSFDANDPAYLTVADAIQRAGETLTTVKRDGRDPFAEQRVSVTASATGPTFGYLFDQWLNKHGKVNKKSWPNDVSVYNLHIKPRLGDFEVKPLKRRDYIAVLDDIAAKVSGIQANRSQSIISAVLNWSVNEDLIEINPTQGITKRGKEIARDRVLTDDELRRFWRSLGNEPWDRGIKLLLLTGQRRSEVAGAAPEEFSGDIWSIPASRTKNGLSHLVPLTRPARYLFGGASLCDPSTLTHKVMDYARTLGIDDFRCHDLRHCAATGMAKIGVPPHIIERVQNQITGRKSTMGGTYNQYEYLDERRRALRLWEWKLRGIVRGWDLKIKY
jgi:integrase